MTINPMEMKRLLHVRAKRELEAKGYGLKKQQDGSFLLLNGTTEKPLAEFPDIVILGQLMHLWGRTHAELVKANGGFNRPYDRDPANGLDTPETAAAREKCHSDAPKAPATPKPVTAAGAGKGKAFRDAHRR